MANRSFTRAMRRKTQWAGFGTAAGAATLPIRVDLTAGTAAILSTGAVISGGVGIVDEEFTVTRTIGNFIARMAAATVDLSATVAVGCAVARVEAISAGVASLPSPEADPDFEWLYYAQFGLEQGETADIAYQLSNVRQSFDVRGQRIVRSGQTLVWLAESESAACVAMVGGRYLVKLT